MSKGDWQRPTNKKKFDKDHVKGGLFPLNRISRYSFCANILRHLEFPPFAPSEWMNDFGTDRPAGNKARILTP